MNETSPVRTVPTFRRIARSAFHSLGGLECVRYRNRAVPRVLMYHRFTSGSETRGPEFKKQCEHLRKYYHPISELQLREWILEGRPLPENAVLLTVDDGYEDFATVALPVLCHYEIPSLVFVVSDFIDAGSWLWRDRVTYAFRHTIRKRIELAIADHRLSLSTDTPQVRYAAVTSILDLLVHISDASRLYAVDELLKTLEVDVPEHPTVDYLPMTWRQMECATSQGVSFGGHTRSHPVLTRLPNQQMVYDEIVCGKKRIEEKLNRPVVAFAYPNGKKEDVDDSVVDTVRRAGFDIAFLAERGMLGRGDDPLQLRRIPASPDDNDYYFRQELAGFRVPGAGSGPDSRSSRAEFWAAGSLECSDPSIALSQVAGADDSGD